MAKVRPVRPLPSAADLARNSHRIAASEVIGFSGAHDRGADDGVPEHPGQRDLGSLSRHGEDRPPADDGEPLAAGTGILPSP
jgi:hypothetical protein